MWCVSGTGCFCFFFFAAHWFGVLCGFLNRETEDTGWRRFLKNLKWQELNLWKGWVTCLDDSQASSFSSLSHSFHHNTRTCQTNTKVELWKGMAYTTSASTVLSYFFLPDLYFHNSSSQFPKKKIPHTCLFFKVIIICISFILFVKFLVCQVNFGWSNFKVLKKCLCN